MAIHSIDDVRAAIPKILEKVPYLRLLVLFGSRARGDSYSSSDWDFALLFDEDLRSQYEIGGGWDSYRSWGIFQQILDLGDDEMDWIDLKKASELLAHAIARDGVVIYEREPRIFEEFQKTALMSNAELKAYRKTVREKVHAALERWKA
jgi:uncharacterized protein